MTLLRSLQNEAGRRQNERFIVEESELVRRAMDLGAQVESVLLTDTFARSAEGAHIADQATAAGLAVRTAAEGLLGKTLGAKPVPDCLAIVKRKLAPLGKIIGGTCPLVQMVEHCESADNLGMLLRSTDAAGVSGVILTADTTDPFSRRTVRGSRGAVFTVPLCIAGDTGGAVQKARENGLRIVAASANADTDYTSFDYTGPTMIIVGNEHTGISAGVRALADAVVRIPMRGRIHSLNIAVAASVLLYESLRQRGIGLQTACSLNSP